MIQPFNNGDAADDIRGKLNQSLRVAMDDLGTLADGSDLASISGNGFGIAPLISAAGLGFDGKTVSFIQHVTISGDKIQQVFYVESGQASITAFRLISGSVTEGWQVPPTGGDGGAGKEFTDAELLEGTGTEYGMATAAQLATYRQLTIRGNASATGGGFTELTDIDTIQFSNPLGQVGLTASISTFEGRKIQTISVRIPPRPTTSQLSNSGNTTSYTWSPKTIAEAIAIHSTGGGPTVLKDWQLVGGPSIPDFELTAGLTLSSLDGVEVEYRIKSNPLGSGNVACGILVRKSAGEDSTHNVGHTSLTTSTEAALTAVNFSGEQPNFLYRSADASPLEMLEGNIKYRSIATTGSFVVAGEGGNLGVNGILNSEVISKNTYIISASSNFDNLVELWFHDSFNLVTSLEYRIIRN